MTHAEYWTEIESIGRDVQENAGDQDPQDYLRDLIDSHQWVIYNAHHLSALQHCSDESIGIEEGAVDAPRALLDGGLFGLTAQLVYCAMRHDVEQWLAENDAEVMPEDEKDAIFEATGEVIL